MDPLAQLHDIHLPPAIAWWPLAVGWYVVIALIIIVGLFIGWRVYQHYLQQRSYKTAIKQLNDLAKRFAETQNISLIVAEISILLRRVALLNFPRTQVASLYDKAWLEFLDNTGNTNQFTQGAGRLLITAAYQAQIRCSTEEVQNLFALTAYWIKKAK